MNLIKNNVNKQIISFIKIICLLTLFFIPSAFAQYKGATVKKERLLKALRSKQLQTEDIVTVIKTNGVDFTLTPQLRKQLIAAGARPEVIIAVQNNMRIGANESPFKKEVILIPRPEITPQPEYDDLVEKGLNTYKDDKDSVKALDILYSAARLKPENPQPYQMMGFINLYGLNNITESQRLMRESLSRGGSAVFRVFHDDSGNFTKRCTGSLYISSEKIRFESDDNSHTFETLTKNVDTTELDTETSGLWKKYPTLKVFLKFGKEKTKFKFAPVSGREVERNLISRFVNEAKLAGN